MAGDICRTMKETVTLKEVEKFIAEKDPFTETQMIRALDISRKAAKKAIDNLLQLGVIRLLDEWGSRKYYTKSQISKPVTDPGKTHDRQMEFIREIAKDPHEMAAMLSAKDYEQYVYNIEKILEEATDNPTIRLAIVYAIERDLIKEIRSRR